MKTMAFPCLVNSSMEMMESGIPGVTRELVDMFPAAVGIVKEP